jgi:hypothetical protein
MNAGSGVSLRCYLGGVETVIYDGLPSIEQQDSVPHRKT